MATSLALCSPLHLPGIDKSPAAWLLFFSLPTHPPPTHPPKPPPPPTPCYAIQFKVPGPTSTPHNFSQVTCTEESPGHSGHSLGKPEGGGKERSPQRHPEQWVQLSRKRAATKNRPSQELEGKPPARALVLRRQMVSRPSCGSTRSPRHILGSWVERGPCPLAQL